jgi:high affinity Mn2+ porin
MRCGWAVRHGRASPRSRANTFDIALYTRGGYVGELELRYRPLDRAGAVKLGTWVNSGLSGSYSEAVALAALTPGLNANGTVAQTRRGRTKYGLYLNLEQEIADDLALFGRFSWNNGARCLFSRDSFSTGKTLIV